MRGMSQKLLASPLTQNILKTAKQSALEGGLNVATDMLQGKKFGKSLGENVATAKKAVTDSLVSALKRAKVSTVVGNEAVKGKKRKRAAAATTLPATVVTKKIKRKKRSYGDLFESY
jgi:hypothetical protein